MERDSLFARVLALGGGKLADGAAHAGGAAAHGRRTRERAVVARTAAHSV